MARRLVWAALAELRLGHLRITLPDGSLLHFGSDGGRPHALPLGLSTGADLRVRRESFFTRSLFSGDIGFAEAYIDGDWDTDDLTSLLSWFILNIDQAPTLSGSAARRGRSWMLGVGRLIDRLRHLRRENTEATARRNIREHYDLSNQFFTLFLDPAMMYSSGLWTDACTTLEQAQLQKNEALCGALRLGATDRVLEIGSGWGGWAMHAARTRGCHVTSVTISDEQFTLARKRVADAGLTHLVDVQLRDYRNIDGAFDKVVSIEMMEAIGHRYLDAFCETIDRVLVPQGLAALQFITCADSRYNELRRGVDFIQKHIFPGSLLLSANRVSDLLSRRGGFVLHDLRDMGHDYAMTLRAWRDAFEQRLGEVGALGFDERFIRKWRYYLAYCEAAFAMRNVSVVQAVYTRPNNHSLGPWHRS